jgi:hypothetical protein
MKNIKFVLLSLSAFVLAFSCTKDQTGIPDTGDLAQGIMMPGMEKVILCAELKPGSGATKAEVFWNDGEENISFDIVFTEGKKFQKQIVVPEGSYIFRLLAFDASGKRVVDFPMAGRSYGANYINELKNRVPTYYRMDENGDLNISWGANLKGSIRSVVTYNKVGAVDPVEVPVAPDATTTILEGFDIPNFENEEFSVLSYSYPEMTLYYPSVRPSSVPEDFVYDEFAPTAATPYTLSGPTDITSQYLKNAGPNIEGKDVVNNKYGLPVDWNITDNVKNQDGGTTGGWKNEGGEVGNVMHFETAGWDNPGTGYQNGKVWQSPTLPAGTYAFTANYLQGDGNPGADMYVVAARGTVLPDIGNFATGALASKAVDRNVRGEYTVIFTLTEETQVSLGLVVTLVGVDEGSDAHWQQFSYFKIAEINTIIDVSASYLNNFTAPIAGENIVSNKYGTPVNWHYTANVNNQESNTVGVWKYENDEVKGVIHFETSGWESPGTGYQNGKVWQSPTLPAGSYSFTANYRAGDGNPGVEMYVVAAKSDAGLPDIADLSTGALAYNPVTAGTNGEYTVYFTLAEDATVSLGLVVTLADFVSGSSNAHWQQYSYFRISELQMK